MQTIGSNPRTLSSRDFALLAMDHIAYVRPENLEGRDGFGIHAADGTQIGWSEERAIAFAAVIQHDMEPVSVH
jgi:hypothetical protein